LDGDLLTLTDTERVREATLVGFPTPGVTDAVVAFLGRYPDLVSRLAASATFFAQVRWIAAVCGVRDQRGQRPRGSFARGIVRDLVRTAERTLMSLSASPLQGVRSPRVSRFYGFGKRLELLAALYAISGCEPTPGLADTVIPPLVAVIGDIPRGELSQIVSALRSEELSTWRSRRTQVDVAVLRLLDEPDDVESWSFLRDVLDVVQTTPEYYEDLEKRFERFLEEVLDEARDMLEDEENDLSRADLSLDELEELAYRWGVLASEINEIAEQVDARQENGPPRYGDGQQSLITASAALPHEPTKSIFRFL
jgi:hypothetical protein